MADRPILFSAPMVRALLDGRKTQTRRVIKDQDTERRIGGAVCNPSAFPESPYVWLYGCDGSPFRPLENPPKIVQGDRLWVRESWRPHGWFSDCVNVFYKANQGQGYTAMTRQIPYGPEGKSGRKFVPADGRWRPSIHMPRWASRLTLTVTDVRIERLQEISEADCIAEGVPETGNAYDAFCDLWNSINGPDAWDQNPWVAAYTFDVEQRNIDQQNEG